MRVILGMKYAQKCSGGMFDAYIFRRWGGGGGGVGW